MTSYNSFASSPPIFIYCFFAVWVCAKILVPLFRLKFKIENSFSPSVSLIIFNFVAVRFLHIMISEKTDNCIFMTTKHGGHLGFFEGGILVPDQLTWLDRLIIEYADGVTSLFLAQQTGSQASGESLSWEVTFDDLEEEDEGEVILSKLKAGSGETTARRRETCGQHQKKAREEQARAELERRRPLRKGGILKQATSYVQ